MRVGLLRNVIHAFTLSEMHLRKCAWREIYAQQNTLFSREINRA